MQNIKFPIVYHILFSEELEYADSPDSDRHSQTNKDDVDQQSVVNDSTLQPQSAVPDLISE
jgi:hypothetical protein